MNRIKHEGLYQGPSFFVYVFFLVMTLLVSPSAAEAEELKIEVFQPAAHYAHTERENVRVYQGQRYQGLQYRGRRVYLQQAGSALVEERIDSGLSSGPSGSTGVLYRGSVYLIKTLTRDSMRILQPVDREIDITCRVSPQGFTAVEGSDLPIRTGFPVLAEGDIAPGDTWKANGGDAIYLEDGVLVTQPFQCTYTYRGAGTYMERPAQIIDFTYTFAKAGPYGTRPRALRGTGSGEIALFTDQRGGYFIKERLTRHYLENGTPTTREEGFRLTWGRGITIGEIESLERTMVAALQDGELDDESGRSPSGDTRLSARAVPGEQPPGSVTGAGEDEQEKIEVERTTEGIKLNLPRIHFVPDQAEILPREKDRLDKLAHMLKKVPEASFLVKGHTADVGSAESQYELSVERARTIIEEMVARGLESSRFVYQGLGGDEQVAPNESEEGRARNRRVEVIILNQ